MKTNKGLQRRHLEALVAVADKQSVHAAARALGMPQPALSRLVSEAEKLLGDRVFDRSSHGCTPTPKSMAVLSQARFVLRGLEQLGSMVADARPTIRLGCIPRAMYALLPSLLNLLHAGPTRAAQASKPGFELSVKEGTSNELMDELSQGKLDFAVLRSANLPAGDEHLQLERLYDDKIVIICSSSQKELAGSAVVPLRSLLKEGWVLPEAKTTSRMGFDAFLREHKLEAVKPVIEVRSFEANQALVASTRFFSIAPESIARRYLKIGLRIVPVRPAPPASPVMLAFNRQQLQNPLFASVRNLLVQAARSC